MRKSSIYIDEDVDLALTRMAAAEGRSKADLIRDSLRATVAPALRIKPRAAGVFAGPADLAARADDHLTEAGFGEQ
ncbi:MAG: ribbon-helix-helix domain-containing protein [Candidatus Dormibacteria bacterium]